MNEELLKKTDIVLSQFDAARDKIKQVAEQCKNIIVTDQGSLDTAKNLAKDASKIEKIIDEKRKEITKPILDEKKRIDDFAKDLTTELNNSLKGLRAQILSFEQEQDRIRRDELRRIEEERIRKEEELRKAVEENKEVTSEQVHELQEIKQQQVVMQSEPASSSIRKVWDWVLADIKQVPIEYLTVDPVKVKQAVANGAREIPGISIFQKDQLYLR